MVHIPLVIPWIGNRPVIPALFQKKDGSYTVLNALVDSGAQPGVSMQMSDLVKLGYNQQDVKKKSLGIANIIGSTGSAGQANIFPLSVKIAPNEPPMAVRATVLPTTTTSFILLGHGSVWQYYNVIFDENRLIFRRKHAGHQPTPIPTPPAAIVPVVGTGTVPTAPRAPGSVPPNSPVLPPLALPQPPGSAISLKFGQFEITDKQAIIVLVGFLLVIGLLSQR